MPARRPRIGRAPLMPARPWPRRWPLSLMLPNLVALLGAGGALAQPALVPWPQQVEWCEGRFTLRGVTVLAQPGLEAWAETVRAPLRSLGALAPDADGSARYLRVEQDPRLPGEGYALTLGEREACLRARTDAGVRHAMRTLQQLESVDTLGVPGWPCARIEDAPRYAWRGTMLDVSRHFYSVEFLKRYLEELARLKLNVFHWHLTDDQGWRVEVKKYPALTGVGAWRAGPDGEPYGGFYTQEEVREVVAHASERGITVVPEIEFPGHCTAALAAYPHLGCRGERPDVPTHWGVFQDVYCVGRETTWSFLEEVLDELLPLFSSAWVHIGGDEVPRDRWRACEDCQRRMRQEGLRNEDELQAWAIRRVQDYLRGRGKQLVGWDEILEGGLDSTALVEVWRGEEPARAARRNGNRMIRTLYFNTSPAVLKLDDVMRYDPRLDGTDAQVLGAECPVWSEQIDERNIGYMVFPRLQAFAERLWTGGEPRPDLRPRLASHVERLEREGWITAQEDRALFDARVRYDAGRGDWVVTVASGRRDLEVAIRSAAMSGVFADSVRLDVPGRVSLAPVWKGRELQDARSFRIERHLGLRAAQMLSDPPDPRYGLDPRQGLSDGLLGTDDFRDGLWQGWEGRDLVVTLDFGNAREIHRIGIRCLQDVTSWILLPPAVEFQISSGDEHWLPLPVVVHALPIEPGAHLVHEFAVDLPRPAIARRVRAILRNRGPMPAWHLGAGGESWIFADELVVR